MERIKNNNTYAFRIEFRKLKTEKTKDLSVTADKK